MPNFADILTKTADTIERPPLGPKGTYVFVVTGQAKKQDRKEYEVLDFPLKAVSAADDGTVDPDDLKAYGNPNGIIVRKSFLFNTTDENAFRQTEFQLKEWLTKHLGQDEGLTMKELMSGAVNKKCLGVLDYRPNAENPEIQYHDLKKTAPLE
jgi:hypothetical protein